MRNFLLALLIPFNVLSAYGQTWTTVVDSAGGYSFDLPADPLVHDTLYLRMYSYQKDSIISFQVIKFDTAIFDGSNELFSQALLQTEGDTLRAMATIMLLVSNSELLSIDTILIGGHRGLKLGLEFPNPDTEDHLITFMQYFHIENTFLSFLVSGRESDVLRLESYKDQFFESISFQ